MKKMPPRARRRPTETTKTKARQAKKVPAPRVGVRAQPLIAVRDVRASSRWYSKLLGVPKLGEHPHRDFYDRLHRGGSLILQLHAWDEEQHPNLVDADAAPVGHGVLLWFEVTPYGPWE